MRTHIYDGLFKLLSLIIASAIIFCGDTFLDKIENHYLHITVFISLLLVLFTLIFYGFFRTIGSYLYANRSLKMNITMAQAKNLNPAFSPFLFSNSDWLPMLELKDNTTDVKYNIALQHLEYWQAEKKHQRLLEKKEFKDYNLAQKIIHILRNIAVVGAAITGFLNLPPASYITNFICKVFNINSYIPILNIAILLIPIFLISEFLKKQLAK
jgi:hypothetical protein